MNDGEGREVCPRRGPWNLAQRREVLPPWGHLDAPVLVPLVVLAALALLVGCASRPAPPATIVVVPMVLTPAPTLAAPIAWYVGLVDDQGCQTYENLSDRPQAVSWGSQAWEVPRGGRMRACPGELLVCDTAAQESCRTVEDR